MAQVQGNFTPHISSDVSDLDSKYPPNNRRANKEEKPKFEKVITGDVVQKKKSLGQKLAETFTGDDIEHVGEYVFFEVIVPATKSLIQDVITESTSRMLFGESARRVSTRPTGSYTSYNRYYSEDRRKREEPRDISRRGRSQHDFSEIILDSREEANAVLNQLLECIDTYDVASVSDMYDMVGVTSDFTDNKWGWRNLREAKITRVRDGYLLDLPKPEVIN